MVAALVIWHDDVLPFPVIVPQHTTPESGGYDASGLPPSMQFAGSRQVMLIVTSLPASPGPVSGAASVPVSFAVSPPPESLTVLSATASVPPSVPLSSPPQA